MALTDNLVSYYKLDSTPNDSLGTNNGTWGGTATYTTGKIGNGADFNTTRYINYGNTFNYERTQARTKNFWHKFTDAGANKHLLSKQDSSSTFGQWLEISAGKYGYWLYQSSSRVVKETTSAYNDGNWHMVTVTRDGSGGIAGLLFYIDGSLVSSTGKSPNTGTISQTMLNTTGFQMNGRWNSTDSTHTGIMDEVGIRTRVLSTGEITTLYNSGNGLTYPFSTNNGAGFLMMM